MANNQNLKPFTKKDPRINNKGIKGQRITTILNKMLDKNLPETIAQLKHLKSMKAITHAEAVAATLLMAVHSKVSMNQLKAIEQILDRTEGKPAQYVDITTQGEKFNHRPPTVVIKNPHVSGKES